MAQIHYVVVYDTEKGTFDIDGDTALGLMPDGAVYEPTEDWRGWRCDNPTDRYGEVFDWLWELVKDFRGETFTPDPDFEEED